MNALTTSAFDLPNHLHAKADPAAIVDDERHLAAVATSLDESIADLSARLDAARRIPARAGQAALDRDQEVRRLSARLRMLRRFGLDLCLGRMVSAAESEPLYIGRLGLTDATGRRLLLDWRSPAAEPFFGATHANPMGLISRRRYRWTRGRIVDYWDEVFTAEGLAGNVALDDQSAFIASLAGSRSPRMRDVLGTIQSDQDAIIRAGSEGTLVVDGGPGTGKTVVALHRAAYLLYADPRLDRSRGGVLFVGPHQPYLSYVADVLPSLGEDGVRTCTLRDLVPEGRGATAEPDPAVTRLKSTADMVEAIEPAVRLYEEPPHEGMFVETPWTAVWFSPEDWAEAFDVVEPGTPHNEAREDIWEAVVSILIDRFDFTVPTDLLHQSLAQNEDLDRAVSRAWPILEPDDLIGDLWSVPAYLRRCAPWLSPAELTLLQRRDVRAWTVDDLPLLDAARRRLGDPAESRRRRRSRSILATQRAQMDEVVEDLINAEVHDDGEGVMTMLRGSDMRDALVDESATERADEDPLAGQFAHVIVDEAQELTDAEWRMLIARCPSRSFTVVGDRAQARRGFIESWQERLDRVGLDRIEQASLTINYRTPAEIMAEAEQVIRAALPDANVPTSVRETGVPVTYGSANELSTVLDDWLASHAEGIACVVGAPLPLTSKTPGVPENVTGQVEDLAERPRVRSLTPELAKGLEFDLVVLVDPEGFGTGVSGAVDHYVAMTRATEQLVVLTSR